jgi:hypothetical protein
VGVQGRKKLIGAGSCPEKDNRQYTPLKRQSTFTRLQSTTSQKSVTSITKFVSIKYAADEAITEQFIRDFLTAPAKWTFASYTMPVVYNAGQPGFKREMHGKWAVACWWKTHTHSSTVSQSVTSLTHSYTTMAVISVDGSLLSRLYMTSGAERIITTAFCNQCSHQETFSFMDRHQVKWGNHILSGSFRAHSFLTIARNHYAL